MNDRELIDAWMADLMPLEAAAKAAEKRFADRLMLNPIRTVTPVFLWFHQSAVDAEVVRLNAWWDTIQVLDRYEPRSQNDVWHGFYSAEQPEALAMAICIAALRWKGIDIVREV